MNTKKQIGANIRGLREYYGETQEALAHSLNLGGKSAIQNYEKGRREPDRDTLAAIAAHYSVSVEELLCCDFSSLKKGVKVDEYAFFKYIDIILPISSSEKAMQSIEFRKAFEAHRSFYNQCHTFSKNKTGTLVNAFENAIYMCPDGYIEAIDRDENCIEACINYLSLLYLLMMIIKLLPIAMKIKPASIEKLAEINERINSLLNNPDPSIVAFANESMNDLNDEDVRRFHSDLLIAAKGSPEWSDLADYYLALQFLWNLVENDLDWGFNQRIGVEMLKAFASVNNPYATQFLKLGFDSISANGTQTVVDK